MTARKKELLRTCVTRYPSIDKHDAEEFGFAPHTVLFSEAQRCLVVLQWQSEKGPDFSLNQEALTEAWEWLEDGMCREAYIGQIDPENPNRLLAWETVENVRRNLEGVEPREGEYGPYWYIRSKTFDVGSSRKNLYREPLPRGFFDVEFREARRSRRRNNVLPIRRR